MTPLELAIRARAQVELQLVSRHLWGIDRDCAEKVKRYLDDLIDELNGSFDKCPNRPRTREEREQEPQVKLKPRDAS